jgi:hypothetical protein
VEIMEKVPFIGNNSEDSSERGRVRLLGKLENTNGFEPKDFNQLIKSAVERMDRNQQGEKVVLEDELRNDYGEEDLFERHLSYRVKVGSSEVTENGEDGIVEGTTFKVILRAQPTRAIEINGPDKVSSPYRDSLKTSYRKTFGEEVEFRHILSD